MSDSRKLAGTIVTPLPASQKNLHGRSFT